MMEGAGFEWDQEKETENIRKHGVSFREAQLAFLDPCRLITRDLKHGGKELRNFCLGKVGGGILTVRFTYRGNVVRIIGAGYWRKGREFYEEKNSLHG